MKTGSPIKEKNRLAYIIAKYQLNGFTRHAAQEFSTFVKNKLFFKFYSFVKNNFDSGYGEKMNNVAQIFVHQ